MHLLGLLLAASAPAATVDLPIEGLAAVSGYTACTGQENPQSAAAVSETTREVRIAAILKRCHAARQTAASEADRAIAKVPGYADPATRGARIAAYLDFIDERVRFVILHPEQAVAQDRAYETCLAEEAC